METIAIIIFLGSLLGIAVILVRKIPVLLTLPPEIKKLKESSFSRLKNKVKVLNPLRFLPSEIFLQKILSKVRVLTLKIENKTADWLASLREKSKKKKELENDKYWEELKNSTNRKSKNLPG